MGIVANADCANLSILFQLFKCPESFLLRNFRVGPVDLVKVDIIGIQPLQARLTVGDNIVIMQAIAVDLGGDNRLIAAVFNRFAQDFFAFAVPVFFGGIQQGNAGIQRGVDSIY